MASTPTLLTLPLEIRRGIYSHLSPNDRTIDLLFEGCNAPTRNLQCVCRQLYHEVLDYYYSTRVFHFSLATRYWGPKSITPTLQPLERNLRRVQNLQLTIRTFDAKHANGFILCMGPGSWRFQQRNWFLETLVRLKRGEGAGNLLKRLIVLDERVGGWSATEATLSTDEVYLWLVGPLRGQVGEIVVEKWDVLEGLLGRDTSGGC
ncbi:MAG: hypothetical protein Q9175_000208 [Cornicularia normoerica]